MYSKVLSTLATKVVAESPEMATIIVCRRMSVTVAEETVAVFGVFGFRQYYMDRAYLCQGTPLSG